MDIFGRNWMTPVFHLVLAAFGFVGIRHGLPPGPGEMSGQAPLFRLIVSPGDYPSTSKTEEDEMQARLVVLGMIMVHLVCFTHVGHPYPVPFPAESERGPAGAQGGVIQGQVFAAEGEHPLARATVALYSADGRSNERPPTVRTDDRGTYEFRDLEAGKYLSASEPQRLPSNVLRTRDILTIGNTTESHASLACVRPGHGRHRFQVDSRRRGGRDRGGPA